MSPECSPYTTTTNTDKRGISYLAKARKSTWTGTEWHCRHGLRQDKCKKCRERSFCKHDKRKYNCIHCRVEESLRKEKENCLIPNNTLSRLVVVCSIHRKLYFS